MFRKLTESWPVAWWYSIVCLLLTISPELKAGGQGQSALKQTNTALPVEPGLFSVGMSGPEEGVGLRLRDYVGRHHLSRTGLSYLLFFPQYLQLIPRDLHQTHRRRHVDIELCPHQQSDCRAEPCIRL